MNTDLMNNGCNEIQNSLQSVNLLWRYTPWPRHRTSGMESSGRMWHGLPQTDIVVAQ